MSLRVFKRNCKMTPIPNMFGLNFVGLKFSIYILHVCDIKRNVMNPCTKPLIIYYKEEFQPYPKWRLKSWWRHQMESFLRYWPFVTYIKSIQIIQCPQLFGQKYQNVHYTTHIHQIHYPDCFRSFIIRRFVMKFDSEYVSRAFENKDTQVSHLKIHCLAVPTYGNTNVCDFHFKWNDTVFQGIQWAQPQHCFN